MFTRAKCTLLATALSTLALACGGGTRARATGADAHPEVDLIIRNYSFIPQDLVVAPGTTIRVVNEDPVPHSVTSQTAPAQYVPGSAFGVQFDTGPFTGETTIYIPANALSGAIIPYYCSGHRGQMANDGEIVVQDPTQP
jgi:plastocyanin